MWPDRLLNWGPLGPDRATDCAILPSFGTSGIFFLFKFIFHSTLFFSCLCSSTEEEHYFLVL